MELIAVVRDRLLSGIALDAHDNVFAVCACSGEIFRFDDVSGEMISIMPTEASPHGITIDPQSGDMYISDRAENAILKLRKVKRDSTPGPTRGQHVAYDMTNYLSTFDDRPLIGPTALTFAPNGELFFTDAGVEGDSSFSDPLGAVYRTVQGRSQLVPVCSRGLIRPSGIAIAPNRNVYVCEQGMNRVLRFTPRGTHYIGNVFAHLQGGMGPVAIAVRPTDGSIFVAQYDTRYAAADENGKDGSSAGGVITVLTSCGDICGVVRTPSPCIRAIALDSPGMTLYALDVDEVKGCSNLYRFTVPNVVQEEGKCEEMEP